MTFVDPAPEPPRAALLPQPVPLRPLGPIERFFVVPIVFATRLIVTVIVLVLWIFPIGPVWLALLFRTIAAFAWGTVISLFSHNQLPDQTRLEYVASFWVRGFATLLATLRGQAPLNEIVPERSILNPFVELLIACLFYLYVVLTLAYINYWLPIFAWMFGWAWYGIKQIFYALYLLAKLLIDKFS